MCFNNNCKNLIYKSHLTALNSFQVKHNSLKILMVLKGLEIFCVSSHICHLFSLFYTLRDLSLFIRHLPPTPPLKSSVLVCLVRYTNWLKIFCSFTDDILLNARNSQIVQIRNQSIEIRRGFQLFFSSPLDHLPISAESVGKVSFFS